MKFFFVLAFSFLSVCLCACQVNTATKISVETGKSLNLDEQGRPLPMVLRVYQLNSDAAFKQASFEELWKKDKEILASELVQSHEYLIIPDKEFQFTIPHHDKSEFIGVLGLFREPIYPYWRILKKAPGGWFWRKIKLKAEDNKLEFAK